MTEGGRGRGRFWRSKNITVVSYLSFTDILTDKQSNIKSCCALLKEKEDHAFCLGLDLYTSFESPKHCATSRVVA